MRLFEPQDLGAHRLRGQGVAAALEDGRPRRCGASSASIWAAGAGIDAVEHAVHQRRAVARPPAACRGRWRWWRPRRWPPGRGRCRPAARAMMATKSPHQSSSGRCSAQPGCGTSISCGRVAEATTRPVGIGDDALGLEGADVDAERVGQGARSARGPAPMPSSAASSSVTRPRYRRGSHDLQRRVRVAHRHAQVEAGHALGAHELDVAEVGQQTGVGRALQRQAAPAARPPPSACTSAGCGMTPLSVPRPWNENIDIAGPPPERDIAARPPPPACRSPASCRPRWRCPVPAPWPRAATPRRLCSSCTDNTRCTVGPALPSARRRQREQRRAAGAVVDGGAGDAPAGQLQHPWQVDHGRADADAGGFGLRLRGEAGVDGELRVGHHGVLLVRRAWRGGSCWR